MEPSTGLEPALSAWKAEVLPLHHDGIYLFLGMLRGFGFSRFPEPFVHAQGWQRKQELNLCIWESKSHAFPLGDSSVLSKIVEILSNFVEKSRKVPNGKTQGRNPGSYSCAFLLAASLALAASFRFHTATVIRSDRRFWPVSSQSW